MVEPLMVDFHEELECIVYETMDRFVPVVFGIFVERGEYDGQNGRVIIAD